MNAAAASPAEHTYANPWLVALVVSIATFMEVLDTTITNVSLTHIAGNLGASPDESTWVLTSYLVANGIVLPISGWLANTMGRKRFFLLCIAGFTASSFACGAAESLDMLVFLRLIQGLCGGGLQPTQQSIVLDAFPPEKRGAVFGITGITLIAAPIIGPTLGGWITDNFSWRWIFFINVPVGTIAFLLVSRVVHESKGTGFKSIDYIGLSLVAIGLGCLQVVLDKGQQKDWFDSAFIDTLLAVSATCLLSAIFWLLRQKDPVIDLRLLKERSFGVACLLIFFTGFALYGSSALLPLLVQSQFGYDATLAGLILSPGGVAVIVLMPISGKLISKIPAKYLVMFGFTLCAIGMWATSFVTPQTDYNHFVWMRILQVLGLPFLFIPVSTLAFMKIPKPKNNKASAFFALCRNLGGSIGIAIAASYVSRHQQMHQNYLSQHMNPSDPVYQFNLHRIAQYFINQGSTQAQALQQATGRLYQEFLGQVTILAYNDAYQFLTLVMIIGIGLASLLPINRPKQPSSDAAAAAH